MWGEVCWGEGRQVLKLYSHLAYVQNCVKCKFVSRFFSMIVGSLTWSTVPEEWLMSFYIFLLTILNFDMCRIVKNLQSAGLMITQVACGARHSLALTTGECFISYIVFVHRQCENV